MSGRLLIVLSALTLGGCSSSSGVSTGALLGEGQTSTTAAVPTAAPTGDPTSRAFQVGSTAARAVKCGYNFDPVKLRTNFLANEAATVAPTDIPRIEKVYDTAYNGVAKAVAGQASYCSPEKTADIKTNLTRHLAGDYAPAVAKKQAEEPGWFSNWGGAQDGGPKFGSDGWWEKQTDALGG
ncbi:MAG: hypothetical protein WBY12_04510 [Hyphomicrobium sp.]